MPEVMSEIIEQQVAPSAIQPSVTKTGTDLIMPIQRMADRLRHFSEDVYDLNPESHLSRFMKVLLGDAGAGRLRKRLLIQRMRSSLQGSHFYDLDRFYGPLFGLKRGPDEVLSINPYEGIATREQWDDVYARDSSFRSRIEQFARAISYGPTPVGMELLAEALLSVDVEINEGFVEADRPYQTYQDLEDQYGNVTVSDNLRSIETDATSWDAEANTNIAQSGTWFFPDGFTPGGGVNSLRLTSIAAGAISTITDGFITATDGTEYTAQAMLFLETNQDVHLEIDWHDSGFGFLSTTIGSSISVVAGVPTPVNVVATAPATSTYAKITVFVEDTAGAAENAYVDRVEWSELNYNDLEGVDYATLEGYGLGNFRNSGRRTFTVRPKRHITLAEAYDLSRVLDKLKPADTRFIIDTKGVALHKPLTIKGAYADSRHWEILQKVASTLSEANLPYVNQSPDPVEQPKPPFSGYQGEAWSYITDLAGVSASYVENGVPNVAPPQRVAYSDGTGVVFSAPQAILPARLVQAGRSVSDAILVGFPYATKLGGRAIPEFDDDNDPAQKLYVDGVPLKELNRSIETIQRIDPFQQNPENRFWVSQARPMSDTDIEEIIEVRLNNLSWVNYVSFEMVKFPHILSCEIFDVELGEWVEIFTHLIDFSTPRIIEPGIDFDRTSGHPLHSFPNHWQKISERFEPRYTRRVRLRMRRIEGTPPLKTLHTFDRNRRFDPPTQELDYSLAIRSWDVGYRITYRSDFDFIETDVLGQTIDPIGSQIQFEALEYVPARAIDGNDTTAWRSEPQVVNYSVVNFYLDTRTADGTDGQVIDRFYLDPTHAGPNFSIYYSNDPGVPDGTNEWFDDLVWTPIPRNYTLQKGYVHIPTTRARFFKFEFSSLVPELYESFIPIQRTTKLFPSSLIRDLAIIQGQAVEARVPGMTTSIETASEIRYRDALDALLEAQEADPPDPTEYRPTDALWITNLEGAQSVAQQAWQFQFTPWHQEDGQYPRFNKTGQHFYEQVKVRHTSKVAFFVGLRTIEAYRTKYEEDENSTVYMDTFDDFRNLDITTGITWVIEPGYLHGEGTSPPVVAESRTYFSREPIKALQFATVQSHPVQLVPDHTFRSPALATYTWDSEDSFQTMGDSTLVYDPSDYSVINFRYVTPIQKAIDRVGGIVQPIVQPVFGERLYEVSDEAALAATFGGMRTPLMGLSERGRAYAAVRFVMQTEQTAPLILRVYDNTDSDAILVEREITAKRGEIKEEYVGFDIPDTVTVVWMSLTQEGKTFDQWKVYALSMFDEAILWEFSNNGGGDWYPAIEIKNNENGILTFPDLGNQLRYRVTGYRVNRWISAIKIRPHYVAYGNARPVGTHRGPNVSIYDHDVPIQDDPLFTSWTKPVPYSWFAESRRFPLLSVEGAQQPTEFNQFYGRPIDDDISGLSDVATALRTIVRSVGENLAFLSPTEDEATRVLNAERDVSEDLSVTFSDSATAYVIIGEGDPLNAPIPDDV